MNLNVQLDLVEDQVEKELTDIVGYQAIVGSLMYPVLATWHNMSLAVTALC
jgi:hypothetical protein